MSLMLVYDPVRAEVSFIKERFERYAVRCLSDEWRFCGILSAAALDREARDLSEVALCCSDVLSSGEDVIRRVRTENAAALIVVIADASTSPLLYMKPEIMASGLLLRPFSENQIDQTLRQVFEAAALKERERLFHQEVFSISTREEMIRVPYSKVLYFEARAKKIVLCTRHSESSFYSTLEQLSARIPSYFIRCHKGYIVNKLLVERVALAENTLYLYGGFQVPVSRSYKAGVKEAMA